MVVFYVLEDSAKTTVNDKDIKAVKICGIKVKVVKTRLNNYGGGGGDAGVVGASRSGYDTNAMNGSNNCE